jgi:hypothetical protein
MNNRILFDGLFGQLLVARCGSKTLTPAAFRKICGECITFTGEAVTQLEAHHTGGGTGTPTGTKTRTAKS